MSEPLQYRSFPVRADGEGDDAPLRGILTSEQPVAMFDWERGEYVREVLLVEGMELRGEALSLLDTHDSSSVGSVLGSYRNIQRHAADDGTPFPYVTGELDFSKAEADIATKAREGHIREMSVGYRVDTKSTEFVPSGETRSFGTHQVDGPANVRTSWVAQEASVVPIGADTMAKIRGFRSMEDAISHFKNREEDSGAGLTPGTSSTPDDKGGESNADRTKTKPKSNNTPTKSMSDPNHKPDFDEASARVQIEEAISKKNAEVLAIGERVGDRDWAFDQIAKNRSLDQVKDAALEKMANGTPQVENLPQRGESLDLTEKQVKRYDLASALRDLAQGKRVDKNSSFVGEVSDFIAERSGKGTEGLFIPSDFDYRGRDNQQRDLLAGTATDGAELVPTEHGGDMFVPVLRPQLVMTELGARVITGVTGNWEVPRETATPTASTKAEAVAHAEAESQFDPISYTPHAYGFFTEVSDRLIRQGSPAVTQIIQECMNREVRIALDSDGLNGSGTNEAEGIVNTTGVGTSTITVAGSPDFDEVLDYEADIAAANAEMGDLAYLTTPAIRKFLKKTAEYGTDRKPIWQDNEVNGYRAVASNQVAANGLYFGDFSRYWYCVWDGIEIVRTKDSAQAKARMTQFTVNYDADGHLTTPSAFSINA